MNSSNPKPKPRRFSTNAKVLTTTAAVATLVAGWNAIAHWDNAQADSQASSQASSQLVAASDTATAATFGAETAAAKAVLPTATATPAATVSADSLRLAPVPTLSPLTDVFTQALQAANAVAQVDLTLPAVAVPVALPTLEPLPALPSAPAAAQIQVPAPNTSSQSSSRGHATSGGS